METVQPNAHHSLREPGHAVNDFVEDAAQLLQGDESALKRAAQKLQRAKAEFMRAEEEAILNAKHAVRVTDRTVQQHPYAAMGAAAGVGFLLGWLIARR